MAWVRYGMWDRWRDLTRFRLACEMALASYRTYVNGFPIASASPLVVLDRAAFVRHVGVLRGFARSMADGVANMADAS